MNPVRRDAVELVLAGGGTAGHVIPGIELARTLSDRFQMDEESFLFVGTTRGSGADVVQAAGYRFMTLEMSGLERKKLFSNFKTALAFAKALGRCVVLLRRTRPRAVVGLGGYSSLPPLIASWILRIPRTVLQEDATLGISNRAGARLSRKVAVAFPAPPEIFGSKGVRVPPAVRKEIARLAAGRNRPAAKKRLGIDPSRKLVLLFGGSLGAMPVNDAGLALYSRWRDRSDMAVFHICGERFRSDVADRLTELREASDQIDYRLEGFDERIPLLYEACDIAVTRAGATTVGELASSGTPAIVVPSSFVVANHQEPNARALERAGGCLVLLDAEVEKELGPSVDALLSEPARLAAMSSAGPAVVRADRDFADVVAEVAGFS